MTNSLIDASTFGAHLNTPGPSATITTTTIKSSLNADARFALMGASSSDRLNSVAMDLLQGLQNVSITTKLAPILIPDSDELLNPPSDDVVLYEDQEHTIGRQTDLQPIPNSTTMVIVESLKTTVQPVAIENYKALHFPTCYNGWNENGTISDIANCNIPAVSVFTIFFIAIALISICGNFLVLYVVYKNTRMRRPQAVFKASLALADLLLSVLVIPSQVYNIIELILSKRELGVPRFKLIEDGVAAMMPYWIRSVVSSAAFISMTASILTLLVMSIDRLVATRWPIYHRIHNSCTRALASIILVWIISIVPTILINIHPSIEFQLQAYTFTYGPSYSDSSNATTTGAYHQIQLFGIVYSSLCWALPWLITTCLTMGVGVYGWKGLRSIRTIGMGNGNSGGTSGTGHATLRQKISNSSTSSYDHTPVQKLEKKRVLRTKKTQSHSEQTSRNDTKNEDSSRRLVKTLSILVSMYTVCVLPLTIMQLYTWAVFDPENPEARAGDLFRWVWFISSCLFLLQSTFNIFIYHQSREFSEGLKNIFRAQDRSRETSFFTSSRNNTARSGYASRFKRRKLMPNVTMSTSDGAVNPIHIIPPILNNIDPTAYKTLENDSTSTIEPKCVAKCEKKPSVTFVKQVIEARAEKSVLTRVLSRNNDCEEFEDGGGQGSLSSPQQSPITRTVSNISSLPTRLLPTQGAETLITSVIDQVAMPPIIVNQDSGMDTISTNSSDIV